MQPRTANARSIEPEPSASSTIASIKDVSGTSRTTGKEHAHEKTTRKEQVSKATRQSTSAEQSTPSTKVMSRTSGKAAQRDTGAPDPASIKQSILGHVGKNQNDGIGSQDSEIISE